MKKNILISALIGLMFIVVFSCKKNTPSNPSQNTPTCTITAAISATITSTGTPADSSTITPTITLTSTVAVVFDNFSDGDNLTDKAAFGGYWYTYNDAAAQYSSASSCGDSIIWPVATSVALQTPACTPTFVMSSYSAAGETPPPGVTSAYFVRVYGSVDRTATGYQYGYAGFGANILDVANDGFRNTINATASGFTRLQFWYKNGPTVTGSVPWKVRLSTSVLVGAGPCKIEAVDDMPVSAFFSTSTWQKFDKSLANDFANEMWGMTSCGTRAAITACSASAGGLYYLDGGAQYKCSTAQALTALNALEWQTNFPNIAQSYPFDLEIAEVILIK